MSTNGLFRLLNSDLSIKSDERMRFTFNQATVVTSIRRPIGHILKHH